MKLIQKPREFVRQISKYRVVAQFSCVIMPDPPVIKGIVSPVLSAAANQSVLDMTSYLQDSII